MKTLPAKMRITLDLIEVTDAEVEINKKLAAEVGADIEGGTEPYSKFSFQVVSFKSIESYEEFLRKMPLLGK